MTDLGDKIAALLVDQYEALDELAAKFAPEVNAITGDYARSGIHPEDVDPTTWAWIVEYGRPVFNGAEPAEVLGLADLERVPPRERGLQWQQEASFVLGISRALALADSGYLLALCKLSEEQGNALEALTVGASVADLKSASLQSRKRKVANG